MRTPSVINGLIVAIVLAGCAGATAPTATPSPTPTQAPESPTPEPSFRHGVEGLIADLVDADLEAAVTDSFDGQPLAFEGLVVCVNGRDVRVYSYGTEQEAVAAAARIDPHDPSNVGTAIIEWDGWPQFWQRDRILVLYQGNDEATIALLTDLMGQPFAVGRPQPQRLPGGC